MSHKDDLELIPLDLFCATTHVESSVIELLERNGLVEVTVVEHRRYIASAQLERTEKLVRLHDDLGINVEGIEAIEHLLHRMQAMQEELQRLRNRLRRYDDSDR